MSVDLKVMRRLVILGYALVGQMCLAHWAYQGPTSQEFEGLGHPIDLILDGERARQGLKKNPLAPRRDWVIRAAYTLTGLPPTQEQLDRVGEGSEEVEYLEVVDELLADHGYGERWARHWMDVARYADTRGYHFDRDHRYPFAYTYRDWLVKAFNDDLGYDQMIRWQIAGDHLSGSEDDPNLAALGFLTVGLRGGRVETIDDRVDVVTRGFLGTTVSCARCHDHKSDPITMGDYYSLFSIFENMDEPEILPVIGKARDEVAGVDFQAKVAEVEGRREAMREAMHRDLREIPSGGIYLELAWRADLENWDPGRATAESFKRGRYRPALVLKWRDFLRARIADGSSELKDWKEAMGDESQRAILGQRLLAELMAAEEPGELAKLRKHRDFPLNLKVHEMPRFFDTKDSQDDAKHRSELSRLEAEHPGSPPRAMVVRDRANWKRAQVYHRGDPGQRGEAFERHWLGFLGGGEFSEGKSPRLSLAEKIVNPKNPLTARVMANRVWAWHFGRPLTEPSDYGREVPEPRLAPLLDYLALYLQESGYSLKALHRHILSSEAYRLSSSKNESNERRDEGNDFYWRWTPQRLDFESMRDWIHATAGSLEGGSAGGPALPIEDEMMSSRRTVYGFVDRYELASSLVVFDFPHPDLHASKRVETTVPQQALYLMNGVNVLRQADLLSRHPELLAFDDAGEQVRWIYRRVFLRDPRPEEWGIAKQWLEGARGIDFSAPLSGHWEVRHAPWVNEGPGQEEKFPIFSGGVWKTGEDLAIAPRPWLSAGKTHAHPLQGHALILRWQATGKGEVRIKGHLKHSTRQGDELAWQVRDGQGEILAQGGLPPGGRKGVETDLRFLKEGDGLHFYLLAPRGQNMGTTEWNFQVEGRESAEDELQVLSDLRRDFPTSHEPPAVLSESSALADLIQMLWASNDFQFIF